MTSLLPPIQTLSIAYSHQQLQERLIAKFDAVLIVCAQSAALQLMPRLPQAPTWKKLYGQSHHEGATANMQARLPNSTATLVAIAFAKDAASAFAQLTLAGRLAKESGIAQYPRVLLATFGFDETPARVAQEALLAATLAACSPLPQYKSKPVPPNAVQSIVLLHTGPRPDYSTTLATHAGNRLTRWLTTLPPNRLDCATYVDTLRLLAKQQRWDFEFLNENALKKLGAGAFLAVARANARRGAGIVKLSYKPTRTKTGGTRRAQATANSIALIGKGICFDTGGINLKPHRSMYQMHEDMQGSAVAVGTLLALTQLKAPFAVDCWLAITENEIGPQAYRPQEVVTAVNGVTIQVAHSDAEGRMVLADTLALAARKQPQLMIDFATLTGACIVALTERMSGVFTNREAWRASLEQAGRDSGERVWSFPMDEDFDSDLNSPVADILQCTPDSKGDHILAARFLNRFVPAEIPWVHVDLAAGNRSGGLGHIATDCTGFGVRFAVEWLLKHRDERAGIRDTRHETRDTRLETRDASE